jgi:hypothetical protein
MADIFISYKRENQDIVQHIVQGVRDDGMSVWWDQDISPDAPWEATIERELQDAKVVIVAWSTASVASENVKAEARRARVQGKLIQVFVEPCQPPLFFGERQGIDLSAWDGNSNDRRFQVVSDAARAVCAGKRPPAGVGYASKQRRPLAALIAMLAVASVALGFIANLGGARDAVCGLQGLNQRCRDWGLVASDRTPSEARQRLLASVIGTWGRQDRNCADTVSYTVQRGEDGFDRIIAHAPTFESASQVIAAENGVIVARDTAPSASGAREQWEFHPEGDRLVVYDKNGVATTLTRCEH